MGNHELRRILTSALATSLGEFGVFVALSVYAYRQGGAGLLGLAAAVQTVPAVFAASTAPVLVSGRLSHRSLLLVANLTRAILLACVTVAVATGLPVWSVIMLATIHSVVSTVNQPARAALIPDVSRTPAELSTANALISTVNNVGFLFGSGGGGLVVAAASPQVVFGLCGLAYIGAVGVIVGLPVEARASSQSAAALVRSRPTAALRTVMSNPQLRSVFALIAALSVVDGLLGVLVVVAPIRILGLGTSGVGWLNAACGAGGIATGAVAPALVRRCGLALTLLVGGVVLGVPIALVGLKPWPALAIPAWVCLGLGYSTVKSTGMTLVLRLCSEREMLGVLGGLESTFVGFAGCGLILAPLLIKLAGTRATLAITGLLLPIVSLARVRSLRRVEDRAPVPGHEFALLRAYSIFAPLPFATVEMLARRLTSVDAPANTTVIEQGRVGDRWYLIAEGELAVTVDGAPRGRLHAGDGFGEIALLRDVPRTATVRTIAPSRLLALDRASFLLAVGGVAESQEAAEAAADRYSSGALKSEHQAA
jgi:MFS family permease